MKTTFQGCIRIMEEESETTILGSRFRVGGLGLINFEGLEGMM